ncbi:MAG: hypothetical protein AAGF85_20680 [Bacteroidota bacterium]
MIEIFATNIRSIKDARIVEGLFCIVFPRLDVNFDLDDRDRILRVQSTVPIDSKSIVGYMRNLGFAARLID